MRNKYNFYFQSYICHHLAFIKNEIQLVKKRNLLLYARTLNKPDHILRNISNDFCFRNLHIYHSLISTMIQ